MIQNGSSTGVLLLIICTFQQNMPIDRTIINSEEQNCFAPKIGNIPTKDPQMCVQDCLVSGCGELGAVVQLPNSVATLGAFAIWCCGGRATAWGNPNFGGDSAAVQDQLRNISQIQASQFAFAAITSDGRVVTWGNLDYGGDSTAVQDQLRNISQIQASQFAFAAITSDGRVVTWGNLDYGGDSTAVQDQLRNISQIQASQFAFAAITSDGRVVSWGCPNQDADSTAVQDQLRNVQQIQASRRAFAAIKDSLEARGRTVRNDLYKHLAKYSKEYEEWFTPGADNEEIDAGKSPTTWQEFLESTLRDGRWICGLSLLAASRRYGVQIIVIPTAGEEKDKPMSFGHPKTGRPPVVLLLNPLEGHYTLAQLKMGRQWPHHAPQASVANVAFRGGGDDWRPPATPSRDSDHSWRPAATPSHLESKKIRIIKHSICQASCVTRRLTSKTSVEVVSTCAPVELDVSQTDAATAKPIKPSQVVDRFQWTCNLCHEVLRGRLQRSLSSARLRHIKKVHPKKAKQVLPAFKKRIEIATPSAAIPDEQRSWTCPKCKQGFAWMNAGTLRRSRRAHEQACYGLSAKQMRKRCYTRSSWKAKHAKTVENNAALRRSRTDQSMREYNAKGFGPVFRIPASLLGREQFSCAACTFMAQKWKEIRQHQCRQEVGRKAMLQDHRRIAFWSRNREKKPDVIGCLVSNWKLTLHEVKSLEKNLENVGGRKRICPIQKCSWFKDVTQDGDVHPNPGPSDCRHLTAFMINAQGASNSWAVARWTIKHRPCLVVIQEVAMCSRKSADLSRFMLQHGYRSWFAVPPTVNNVRGQEHTFGGVGIFVRRDKSAFQIQQKVCADGQAIMLQLDHAVVIGAYVPPRSQESEIVLEMDNWVASTNSPTLLMGDFNTLPDFANRWSHIRGAGAPCAVRDEQGNLLPTRWDGSRCIDWLWCSHPPMIENLEFDDAKFTDHKALKFKVKYDQSRVLAFKPVKTRNLLPTTDISQNSWKEAMEVAWSDAECPPFSSTDCEWEHFCRIAEQAHVRALEVCNTHPSRPKLTRVKGSDFQVEELEPKTFRLTQHATLRELKLRKLLGRVSEALEQLRRGRRAPQVVYKKIWQHQFVRDRNFQSLQAVADWTELELRTHVKNAQLENLQRWRAQMRSSVQEAGRWVKKTTSLPVTSVFEPAYKHGKASSSNQETLQAVQCFWQSIWTREKPDVQEAFDFWRGGVEPPVPLEWEPLSAAELQEQAKRQHGKASGCDGWQGSEVSSWPSHAFAILAELVERWFARGEMPTVFRNVRQCLLQKPNFKAREPDQALAASSLRPLAIQSVVWRLIASAWTRRSSTRAWVQSWAHRTAFGGLQGTGVSKAIDKLLQVFEKPEGGVLVTLDFAKCFDTINPLLGQKCLRFLGCPQQILSALDMVWNQRRWLCFQDECLPEPQLVSSSVPQGDAISPLTLLALMTGLTGKVLQHEQVPHTLVTYLDDRNFVVKQPEDAAQIWKTWTEMSGKVGLWENADKVKVVPRKGCFRNRLLASGFEESHIANSARVLGVDFTARLGAVDRPTQKQRLQEAGVRIARIDLLPLPADSKASLVSSLAIPKAIWGAWTSVIPGKPLNQCIKKAAGGGHVSASSNLFYLLAGHGLSLHFCGGFAAYLNLADLVRRHPRAWPARSPRGTWLGTVRKWLASLDWSEEGAWKWKHPNIDFSLDLQTLLSPGEKQHEYHQLRESWRRRQFRDFLASGRRDAARLQGAQYQEDRMTLVRKTFRNSGTHARACMIGAVVSDARLARMQNPQAIPGPCQWCTSGEIPTWCHFLWDCSGFADTRCQKPPDLLLQTLGWPSGANTEVDTAVLLHMSTVRQRLLDRRYRGI